MSNRLQNKVSIITGAGTGFGEEIARRFVAEGAKVVLVDINEKNGARVAADLPEGTSVFVQGDVSRGEDWEKFVEVTLSSFGQIDIVVNNAGVVNTSIVSGLPPPILQHVGTDSLTRASHPLSFPKPSLTA